MGFRFRKSIKIMPGVRLNLNTKGASVTIGSRGARYTIGPSGERVTLGIPGTGISYTEKISSTSNVNGTSKSSSKSTSTSKRKMSVCPNCGHRMRKVWVNCPKCKYLLIPSVEQNIEPVLPKKEKTVTVGNQYNSLINNNYIAVQDFPNYKSDNIGNNIYNQTVESQITENHTNEKDNSSYYGTSEIINTEVVSEAQGEKKSEIVKDDINKFVVESSLSKRPKINKILLGVVCLIILFLTTTVINFDGNPEAVARTNINAQKVVGGTPTSTGLVTSEADKKEEKVPPYVPPVDKKEEEKTVEKAPPSEPKITPYYEQAIYIANASTGKIHTDGCRHTYRIKSYNKVTIKGKRAAINSGYTQCNRCQPFN